MPYSRPNNIPFNVHKKSDHPPQIIQNIPMAINKRLSEISYDQNSFDKAVPLYQKELNDSGYKHRLVFSPANALQPPNSAKKVIATGIYFGIVPHTAKKQKCCHQRRTDFPKDPRRRVSNGPRAAQDL